jgi:hypothetical protein
MGRAAAGDEPECMTTALVVRRSEKTVIRSLVYCVALIPLAIAELFGGPKVASWWARLVGEPAQRRPGHAKVLGHAVLSLLLGAAALIPLGIELLFILRGVFYGLVDHGPYNNSWGGPTRAGAWTAHFLISLPMAAAGLAALVGIALVHQRLTLALTGRPAGRWPIVAALLIPIPAVLFFIAWLHQI